VNGPGYALMGLVFLVGALMVASAVFRHRRRPDRWDRRERWFHFGLVVLWVGTLVFIPAVAEPGSQPGPSMVVQLVTMVLIFNAMRNVWLLRR